MHNKNTILLISLLSTCLLALIVGIVQIANFPSQTKPKIFPTQNKILVVNLEGVIQSQLSDDKFGFSDNTSQHALKTLQKAYYDKSIKGVLLRINSPGGTVGASQELYASIARLRTQNKYIVASIADMGASGAYYTASACNMIFANRGSLVGSIGVIMNSVNMQDLFEKLGVKPQTFKAGKYKDLLSMYRGSTDEEKTMVQSMLNDVHHQFMDDIMAFRKNKITQITPLAQGQIFTGEQAKKVGLIDATGGEIEALDFLAKKLNIKLSGASLIYDKNSFFEKILSELNVDSKISDLNRLFSGFFYSYHL